MNQCVGLVCVDVGNTAAKVQFQTVAPEIDRSRVVGCDSVWQSSFRVSKSGWTMALLDWLQPIAANSAIESLETSQWRIASVQRRAAEELKDQIMRSFPAASIHMVRYCDIPMQLDVDYAERVGIDRLLSAYAAWGRYHAPVVIVDAGSAVTVDYVNERGCFCGGAIFPGLQLQTNALWSGTDALPAIDWSVVHAGRIPAKETTEAIALGVFLGVTAAIDRLIDRYDQASCCDTPASVVLCGGDAKFLSKWIEHPHTVVPDLVLKGINGLGC